MGKLARFASYTFLIWSISSVFLLFLPQFVESLSFYDDSDVRVFNSVEEFERDVLLGDGVWAVQFCNEEKPSCKGFSAMYTNLGTLMKGLFGVGVVDINTSHGKAISEHFPSDKVAKVPAVFFIGDDKKNPISLFENEGKDPVGEFLGHVSTVISYRAKKSGSSFPGGQGEKPRQKKKGSQVLEITEKNFEELVVENPGVVAVAFTAAWCGHCQRLKPEWEEAADRLVGTGGILGWVDAERNPQLASEFNVKGFPTIKVFSGPKINALGKAKRNFSDFRGDRTATGIVNYMLQEVDRAGIPMEIPEMTGPDVLEDNCGGHNHICILAILPHILDSGANGRNKYRDLVGVVARKFRGQAFSFLWLEGGSQLDLEETMQLTFGYPAVVAYSLDRQAYGVMRGSFSEKAMTGFLTGITSGRTSIQKLPKLPSISSVEPWDGKDGVAYEDEIPLSEIMGDEL